MTRVEVIMDKIAPECGVGFSYYGTSPVTVCERSKGHDGPHSTREGPPSGYYPYPWMDEIKQAENAKLWE